MLKRSMVLDLHSAHAAVWKLTAHTAWHYVTAGLLKGYLGCLVFLIKSGWCCCLSPCNMCWRTQRNRHRAACLKRIAQGVQSIPVLSGGPASTRPLTPPYLHVCSYIRAVWGAWAGTRGLKGNTDVANALPALVGSTLFMQSRFPPLL